MKTKRFTPSFEYIELCEFNDIPLKEAIQYGLTISDLKAIKEVNLQPENWLSYC